MKRYAWIIGVKGEKIDEYKKLHTDVWLEVLDMIRQCHISNYSIYMRKLPDEKSYLFSFSLWEITYILLIGAFLLVKDDCFQEVT